MAEQSTTDRNSVDAALSMVPEGWKVILGQGNPYRMDNQGTLWIADLVHVFTDPDDGRPNYREVQGKGATPAEALHRAIALTAGD